MARHHSARVLGAVRVKTFYWGLLILAQIWFTCAVTIVPCNPFKVPYRRQERAAVLSALATNPSPVNKAALQQELSLARRYVSDRQYARAGVLLASLLALDIVCAYAWSRAKRQVASPSGFRQRRNGASAHIGRHRRAVPEPGRSAPRRI